MEKFRVEKEKCIACRACVRTAPENFKIEEGKAVVYKQPENEEELSKSQRAMEICPTKAILSLKDKPITGDSKVKETLEKYPHLKEVLLEISPKFRTMQNPVMWNTVAKYATFKNAAKMTGVSLCEILHTLNKKLGLEKELYELFPECIREVTPKYNSVEITWNEPETTIQIPENNMETIALIINQIENLKPGKSLVFEGVLELDPIIKVIESHGFLYNINKINQFKTRVSIYNKEVNEKESNKKNTKSLMLE
ncbi:4Fe-4S domain-containing protein [Marinitoga lauensis]|uniref:4Fe-4S domain-containing protein n=1 Tax=Marinitoga lauensis TaxID=2201189 RepID=UPI001404E154|nr:ferredoxin [Marinitoga lauensis]